MTPHSRGLDAPRPTCAVRGQTWAGRRWGRSWRSFGKRGNEVGAAKGRVQTYHHGAHSPDPPSNADRAALVQILAVINDRESCEGALEEIQRIAVVALNDAPPAGDYWQRWLPDPEHINALPQPVRKYVHDLETNADPAGIVAENALLRDTVGALEVRIRDTGGGHSLC